MVGCVLVRWRRRGRDGLVLDESEILHCVCESAREAVHRAGCIGSDKRNGSNTAK